MTMIRRIFPVLALTIALSREPFAVFVFADGYYPSWGSGTNTGTCIHDDPPPTTFSAANSREPTLEACCLRYYTSTAYNACVLGGGGTITGTNQWYPKWQTNPQRCAQDCAPESGAQCGGILGPGNGVTKYATAGACCAAHYSYQVEGYCVAKANGASYAGSNKWYLDSTENMCVQDCDGSSPCAGVVTESWVTKYDSLALCCSTGLPSLQPEFCQSQSTPNSVGTNKWFVKGDLCKKDCTGTGDVCARATQYDKLYADAGACCAGGLGWSNVDYCKTRSDPATYGTNGAYSNLWFVEYSKSMCVQDCGDAGNLSCAKLSSSGSSTIFYASPDACCSAKLGWIDGTTCKSNSLAGAQATPTGTLKWYADYASKKRCVMDCSDSGNPLCGGIVGTTAGVSLYKDAAECCKNKFGWYQPAICQALSEGGGTANTGKWYANYQENACQQDCPKSGTTSCGGNPTDYSQPLYNSAKECCTAKLGWIDGGACETKSTNGVAAPATGSSKWYALYSGKKCAQDCAVSPANPGCGGIVASNQGLQLFASASACCTDRYGWVNNKLCVALSDGSKYSYQYYPDQGAGVCRQDCEKGTGLCAGNPVDLAVKMYDSVTACCAGSVGWADAATCAQTPASQQGSSSYYINWSLNQCVRDCDKSQGSECGGLKNRWDVTYSSAAACCSQPAMAWKEFSKCKKS